MQLLPTHCVNLIENIFGEMKMDNNTKKFYRSRNDRMIGGVCGGLGAYFNIDPTIVRVIAALGVVLSVSIIFWIYIVLWIVIPEEPAIM
jgi:phage shock protein PspC (stress-responsive transcriptional regulator)